MNTINGTGSTNSLYSILTKNDIEVKKEEEEKEEQKRISNHKKQAQDSIELSQQRVTSLQGANINNSISSSLDSLVSAGTITQEQADAVTNIFEAGRQTMQTARTYNTKPVNPLDSLVSSGTITKEQEESIKSAFEAARKSNQTQTDTEKDPGTTTLDNLVSSGIITEEQEESIRNAFEASFEDAQYQ